MPTSPNILNYFIGKGILYFTPTGGVERDMGNAPSFKFTPKITKLDHFSSREGIKSKDQSIIQAKEATVDITLDEITPANLALALFGIAGTDTSGDATFDLLSESEITGSLRFVGSNEVGNKFTVVVNSVSFTPNAGFDFISDNEGQIQLTGDCFVVAGSFGTVTETADATA